MKVLVIGSARDSIMQKIAEWQVSETVLTHEALWKIINIEFPQFKGIEAHFHYEGITQELFIREGQSKYWGILNYTF